MKRILTYDRQRVTKLLHLALYIFLIIFLSACGDEAIHSSSETGSIAFSVAFQGAPNESSVLSKAIDCGSSGVSTVEARVYDENDSHLVSGGPWDCEAHSGTITSVPAGSNRKVVIVGKDSSGNILYWGEKTGITVTAGQTNSAGTIVASLFCPTPTAPEDGSTVQNGAFSFKWNPAAGVSEYQIQVSTDTTFPTTTIDTTTTNTIYAPPELSYGETYYWQIKAKDSFGNQSIWSEVWSFTVSTEPSIAPSAPTNASAAAGDGQVLISWDSVSGATSYNIYWSTTSGVTKAAGTKISNVTSPYTHAGLTNGTTYYHVVTAENSYGESGESSEVSGTPEAPSIAPSAPTNASAAAGDGEVSISWDSVSGTASYNIYWATTSGVTKSTGTKMTNVSSPYLHTGRTNGTTYYYVVTAENDYGESGESSEVSGTPEAPGTAPSAPTNVTASPGDSQVTISWDSVSGATSYNIYWATYSGVSKTAYEGVFSDAASPYTHTGLTNGTTYYYVVTAENSYGESDESDEVYATISVDEVLAKTELLKGYWYFYYTIISTFDHYYTLDDITGDTNSQGGYFIHGTDEYGDLVVASYWPDDGNWALLDSGSIIDRFYAFYTDGNTILANSCYYQIDNSTGDWSSCYDLDGYKVYSILAIQLKDSVTEAIESEEMKAAEAEEIKTIQSIGETVSDSIKEKYRKMKQVIDSQK